MQIHVAPQSQRSRGEGPRSVIATRPTDGFAKDVFEYRPYAIRACVVLQPYLEVMAIIWKSHGTVGPGSLGAGKSMPLDVIDERLTGFRIFWHGERPKTMLPQSREYYMHIMIEVTDSDLQPHLERFSRPGFYQVVGLRVADAGFLLEPPSLPARPPRRA